VIVIASTGKYFVLNLSSDGQQAQVIESVLPGTYVDDIVIDQSILIDDHEKPIAVKTKQPTPKSEVSAEAYLVANLETGERYIDYNSSKVFPIASVSKIYTALVVHHLFDLEEPISINQTMLDAYGNAGDLKLDEKLLPNDLLHALLLESSNDAAVAFSETFGMEKFMEQMNGFAKEIGMHNTHFGDSSGLSPQNVSSASDLFNLSRYLYNSEKDILEISRTKVFELATTTDHGSHHFVNINPYVNSRDFLGGKTGRTNEAKEAMVSIFNREVDGIVYPIAVIVLRSELGEREVNTGKLLDLFVKKVSLK
jgi:D-alanyl-D-alanine carboxypeptidase